MKILIIWIKINIIVKLHYLKLKNEILYLPRCYNKILNLPNVATHKYTNIYISQKQVAKAVVLDSEASVSHSLCLVNSRKQRPLWWKETLKWETGWTFPSKAYAFNIISHYILLFIKWMTRPFDQTNPKGIIAEPSDRHP